ncbi:MAG: HEAT repeat domain-containing protein [Planctomycetia bacterium]|nr:HEAT repeat domain-containing protein [Planctomycetia bacterium]
MSRAAVLVLVVAVVLARPAPARAADADPAALVEALAGDDTQARYDAYRVLLASHPPEALPLLAKRVPTLPLAAQSFGTSVVAGYPADRTRPVYERWAASDAPYVRMFAGAHLLRQGDAKGSAAVVAVLKAEGTDPTALSMGLSQLTGLRDAAVTAAVRALVRPGAPVAVLGPALYHLQFVDDREAPRVAGPLLSSPDVATRALAAAFLWRTGDEARAADLAAALASPDLPYEAFVRMNPLLSNGPRLPEAVLDALVAIVEGKREGWYLPLVIAHLGTSAWGKAVPVLRTLLDDPGAGVAAAAFEALAKVPGGLRPDDVRALLTGPDEARRVAAAEVLRREDDPAGLDAVVDVLKTGKTARAEAARVLGTFRRRAAVDPLIDALLDPDVSVRAAAQNALAMTFQALFVYRRLDLAATGYRSNATPEANRAAVEKVRAWWRAAKDGDW